MLRNVFQRSCLLWVRFLSLPALASVTYVHTDVLGSPIAETNSSGALVANYHYKPFGETLETKRNDVGYAGHMEDKELGLTYMQQRYYDPVIGRFYSNDPVDTVSHLGKSEWVMGFNRYSYSKNNPYKYFDPDGRAVLQMNGKDLGDVNGAQLLSKIKDQPDGSIKSISIFDHGTSDTMKLSGGDFLNNNTMSDAVTVHSENGAQIGNLSDTLSGKMSSGGSVLLNGCNTASGETNLAATLSSNLGADVSVTGFSSYLLNYSSVGIDQNIGIATTYSGGKEIGTGLKVTSGDFNRVDE